MIVVLVVFSWVWGWFLLDVGLGINLLIWLLVFFLWFVVGMLLVEWVYSLVGLLYWWVCCCVVMVVIVLLGYLVVVLLLVGLEGLVLGMVV